MAAPVNGRTEYQPSTLHWSLKPVDWLGKTAAKADILHQFVKVTKAFLVLAGNVNPEAEKSLEGVVSFLGHFQGAHGGLHSISRLDERLAPKIDHKTETYLPASVSWQPAKARSRDFLMVGHIMDSIMLVRNMGFLELGKLAGNAVGNLTYFSLFHDGAIVMSALYSLKAIYASHGTNNRRIEQLNHSEEKKLKWQRIKAELEDEASVEDTGNQLKIEWENKLQFSDVQSVRNRIEYKLGMLNEGRLNELVDVKIERWDARIDNTRVWSQFERATAGLESIKTWISVAADLSKIAIIVFAGIVIGPMATTPGFWVSVVGCIACYSAWSKALVTADFEEEQEKAMELIREVPKKPELAHGG